ncbi:MAG TPA: hypothetical protein VIL48_19295 [Acidimicrobiales bacterium]
MSSPDTVPGLRQVATFCGKCSCGCPALHVDESAPPERRIVMTDDFGQRIEMSLGQLRDLVDGVRTGALDQLLAGAA